jgi:hypothetical protein
MRLIRRLGPNSRFVRVPAHLGFVQDSHRWLRQNEILWRAPQPLDPIPFRNPRLFHDPGKGSRDAQTAREDTAAARRRIFPSLGQTGGATGPPSQIIKPLLPATEISSTSVLQMRFKFCLERLASARPGRTPGFRNGIGGWCKPSGRRSCCSRRRPSRRIEYRRI